jgi:hypothetical protein
MIVMKVRGAKKSRHLPPRARRRCPEFAARPGNCVLFLARLMSYSAACPAPRREKRSEQTIYDAATREVLQIDFGRRRKWVRREKLRGETGGLHYRKRNRVRKETRAARRSARERKLFPAEKVGDLA